MGNMFKSFIKDTVEMSFTDWNWNIFTYFEVIKLGASAPEP